MKIELWDIDRVKPYGLNAKKHDDRQVDGIINSIQRFGWDQPIVVDSNGEVIKGHGRRLAAIKMGLKKVPVLQRTDLSAEQANAARIADNRVAISDLDTEMLKLGLEALNLDDLTGIFDEKELLFLDSDMTEMNTDMFVENLDNAVTVQAQEIKEQFDKVGAKRISISKALGFKDIVGADQIHISRFMAEIETSTGKKGDEAFVTFIKQLIS